MLSGFESTQILTVPCILLRNDYHFQHTKDRDVNLGDDPHGLHVCKFL